MCGVTLDIPAYMNHVVRMVNTSKCVPIPDLFSATMAAARATADADAEAALNARCSLPTSLFSFVALFRVLSSSQLHSARCRRGLPCVCKHAAMDSFVWCVTAVARLMLCVCGAVALHSRLHASRCSWSVYVCARPSASRGC